MKLAGIQVILDHYKDFENKAAKSDAIERTFNGKVPTMLVQTMYAMTYPYHANALVEHERQVIELQSVLTCTADEANDYIEKHGFDLAMWRAVRGYQL